MPTAQFSSSSSINCPKCGHSTEESVHEATFSVRRCTHCSGVWFERGQLATLVGTAHDVPQFGVQLIGAKPTEMNCPSCRSAALLAMPYATGESLLVNWCRACGGAWLDGTDFTNFETLASDLKALAEGRPCPSKQLTQEARLKSHPKGYDNLWSNLVTLPVAFFLGILLLELTDSLPVGSFIDNIFQKLATHFSALATFENGTPAILLKTVTGVVMIMAFYFKVPPVFLWSKLRFASVAIGSLVIAHAVQQEMRFPAFGMGFIVMVYFVFLAKSFVARRRSIQ